MKLKLTWLFIACFSAFLAVVLSHLPVRADEPVSVSSTTEPYHVESMTGTRKTTTETFKDYKIIDVKIFAKDPDAPTATWRSEHHLVYETLKGRRIKLAKTIEDASATHYIKKQSQGELIWRDMNGDQTEVICNDLTHRAGLRVIDNTLIRRGEGGVLFATGFRTARNPDQGTNYQ